LRIWIVTTGKTGKNVGPNKNVDHDVLKSPKNIGSYRLAYLSLRTSTFALADVP
jgi:hypothetical protein